MFVRTLSTLSLVGLILSVGAILPWSDPVLGTVILLSAVGAATVLTLATVKRARKSFRVAVRVARRVATMAREEASA